MTIVRVGATQKYATGWDSIFAKGKKKAEPAMETPAQKKPAKAAKPKAATKKKVAAKKKK